MIRSTVTAAIGADDTRVATAIATTGTGREGIARTPQTTGDIAAVIEMIAIGVPGNETEVETVIETATITGPIAPIATTAIESVLIDPGASGRLPSSTSELLASHLSQKTTTSTLPLIICYVELTAITTQYDVGPLPSVAD